MDTKCCATCKTTKPLSDFYVHRPSNSYEKHCKECKKAKQKTYAIRPYDVSGVPHEQEIIDLLNGMGIYACSGKRSNYTWVDIVAWGCVAIEAKLGRVKMHRKGKNPQWQFDFTVRQREGGIRGDILILMIDEPTGTRFYLMRSDHPELYDTDGRLKMCITYNPYSTRIDSAYKRAEFENDLRNNWSLIEEVRQEKIEHAFS